MVPDPVEFPQCWRDTLIAQEWDAWGIEVGEGVCIACGYERTYEDWSDQNPVHSTSARTTPRMTKLGRVCVMSPIQVL